MCDSHFLLQVLWKYETLSCFMATTHAFSSAQSYFLCLVCMVFHSHTSSCSQVSSLLKGHFLTIPSKSLFLLLVLIKLVSSFILLVTVYNCGFILSLSLPDCDLSGTVDSKGIDTHSRCLINTWLNAWGWYQGWNWTHISRILLVLLQPPHTSTTKFMELFCLFSVNEVSLHMA